MNVFLLLISLIASPVQSDKCRTTDSLTVRNAHALTYDPDRRVVMLFGGADERQVLGDLWAWDGNEWRCLSDGGPPPRTFPAFTHDEAGKRLVLFGGNRVLFGTAEDSATFLDDMWVWKDQAWEQIETPTPPARAEASMVYDSHRRRIVLFGGYRNEIKGRIRLGDTWEWNGQEWEQRPVEGPKPRNGAAMAYDSGRRRTVLFGGSGNSDDTWEWDGKKWKRIESANTDPRFNTAMAYDARRRTVIRFGGWTRQGRVKGTWAYAGFRWTKLADEGPAARNHAALTFDQERGVIVLFGGHDGEHVFGDTWEWNGYEWQLQTENGPRLRVENGH